MSRKAWVGAGVGVTGAVVVAAVAGLYLVLRDVAEPATVGEAVTRFREEAGSGAAAAVPSGVYVYDTVGFEQTDALTGVRHRYPRRSTITVTRDPCGVRMRWDVLRGRSTTWTFCVGDSGWTLERQDERHTFFGRTEHTDYTCGHTVWSRRQRGPSSTAFVCTTPKAKEQGAVLFLAGRTQVVGGERVKTVHVRKSSTFSGAIRGGSVYDLWLDRSSGVPVQLVMRSQTTNDSPIGDVHYEERVSLRLISLTPRR
jgi:hypothetical protein